MIFQLLTKLLLKEITNLNVNCYHSFFKTRMSKSMGGATAVENYLKCNSVNVTEGEGDDNLIVRIYISKPALNVVNLS